MQDNATADDVFLPGVIFTTTNNWETYTVVDDTKIGAKYGSKTDVNPYAEHCSGQDYFAARITSYNVCYTKLLRSKKRVIVLDLDLRKPRIHLGFNVPNDKGVSTILIGKHTYKECLRTTDIDGFDYITAGPIPPNPAELANSISMENLIHELENFYDVIIIDTPPVGIVADAVANLQRANYPIYVMKANVSNRRFIENINYLVNTKNLENLSVLLNGVEHRKP